MVTRINLLSKLRFIESYPEILYMQLFNGR